MHRSFCSIRRGPLVRCLLALAVSSPPVLPVTGRTAEVEKLPAPAAGGKDTVAAKTGAGERLDRGTVYRFDPIQGKLVAVPAAEIKADHVYFRYSPARSRHVWTKAAGKGRFLYALGPGSVQPARLFDMRATDEEKRKALEARAPTAARLLATQGTLPALKLDDAGRWSLAPSPNDGSVFDLDTGRRLEWHGDHVVEVVHSGGNSWTRSGDRYVPSGSIRSAGR